MHSYSVKDYVGMLADVGRAKAFAAALRKAVHPGSVVAEIGTGVGYFAMLAWQLGARRVYALEVDDVIEVARQMIGRNGCAAAIQLIPSMSTEVELPERADVIFSDLHGVLPLFENAIPSIVDARERLLAPGGRLIPRRDIIWAAVAESAKNYERLVQPLVQFDSGFDVTLLRRMMANNFIHVHLIESDLLAPPQVWATLDYETITDPSWRAQLDFQVSREGTAHGIALWFDSELDEDVSLSNCPNGPEHIYGQAFFALEEPAAVAPGTRIAVQLSAVHTPSGYVWCWNTTVTDKADHILRNYKQSTLLGQPIVPEKMHKRADGFIPTLNGEGVMEQFVLGLMDGNHSIREIAERVLERFPQRFRTFRQSLDWVCERSPKYST
jgi:protein arginine N-methyltransferase 1